MHFSERPTRATPAPIRAPSEDERALEAVLRLHELLLRRVEGGLLARADTGGVREVRLAVGFLGLLT